MTASPHPNPYVGPRAFQVDERLYGRARETSRLLNLLVAERIVLFYSPSGAGKTSLIQAALIPRLREKKFRVFPVVRVNLEPPSTLAQVKNFNRYTFSVLSSLENALPDEQQKPEEELAGMTLAAYLAQRPKSSDAPGPEAIIFDQFEEILTLDPTDQAAKHEFFAQVGEALADRLRWALFAMREDYVASLDPYLLTVPTRFSNTFRLDLLEERAAREAIQQPARQANVDFTDSAAQKLVDDLRQVRVQQLDDSVAKQLGAYVEPMQLQVVCYRLWESLSPEATHIVEADVEAVGDVDTALSGYYAEQVAAIAQKTGVRKRAIRDWFDRQLITEQGIRGQVLMSPERSSGLENRVIRELENAHLVRGEKRRGATWFELAHDRLIQPIRTNNAIWFQENLSVLQRQAGLWEKENRPDRLLLRDQALTEAEQWATAHADELTQMEQHFLELSQGARDREAETRELAEQIVKLEAAQKVAEAERRRAEEQAQSAARLRARNRIVTAMGGLALVAAIIAVFLGLRANVSARTARAAEAQAQVANGTAQAASTLAVDEANSAQANEARANAASTQAWAIAATARASIATLQATYASKEVSQDAQATAAAQDAIATAAVEQDQSKRTLSLRLAAQSASLLEAQPDLALLLAIEAYNVFNTEEATNALLAGLDLGQSQTTKPLGEFSLNGRIYSLAFSPDGQSLAAGTDAGEILILDITTQKPSQYRNDQLGRVFAVAFSPDGQTLAVGSDVGAANNLWNVNDITNGKPLGPLGGLNSWLISAAFNPKDGNLLAYGHVGSTIILWDVANERVARTLAGHRDDVWSVAWSPDGNQLASGSADTTVRIWDPATGAPLSVLTGHTDIVWSVAWSPDGRLLASGSRDNKIILWDISSKQPVGPPLQGHTQEVRSVAFSPDGKILASGSADHTIILWDVVNRTVITQLDNHVHWVKSVAFSSVAGEPLLASGSFDKSILLYRVIGPQQSDQPLTTRACNLAGRNFTPAEWEQFFAGEKYRKTCEQFPEGN